MEDIKNSHTKKLFEKSRKEFLRLKHAPYLKAPELKDGYLYKIFARNASIGIWIDDKKSFLISRFKFNSNFLFEEIHWDFDEYFGTVRPLELIEEVPFKMPKDLDYHDKEVTKKILNYLNKKTKELKLSHDYPREGYR